MKYRIFSFIVLSAFLLTHPLQAGKGETDRAAIQIALLLDTSNSMDGLIDQAKGKLWSIVNEFSRYEKGGEAPELEIALFEYGNDGLDGRTNWIRQVSAFTRDLDFISQKLFELTTYGGSEYCGAVIHEANQELTWSHREGDLKLIFIAGNEGFDQGGFPYGDACREAAGQQIAVNSIYCGEYEQGIRELWKEGAMLGGGRYINIDHNEKVTYIETPYDEQIDRLNRKLNDTYIHFNRKGAEHKVRQETQDRNARSYSISNSADRAAAKASGQYRNDEWDLLDAYEAGGRDLDALDVEEEALPAELKGKSDEEIEAYISEKQAHRSAVSRQILELQEKRRTYIAAQSGMTTNTLDHAIRNAVEHLASEKGFATGK